MVRKHNSQNSVFQVLLRFHKLMRTLGRIFVVHDRRVHPPVRVHVFRLVARHRTGLEVAPFALPEVVAQGLLFMQG